MLVLNSRFCGVALLRMRVLFAAHVSCWCGVWYATGQLVSTSVPQDEQTAEDQPVVPLATGLLEGFLIYAAVSAFHVPLDGSKRT